MRTAIIESVEPLALSSRQVASDLREHLTRATLSTAGAACADSDRFVRKYTPRFALDLFGLHVSVTGLYDNPDLRCFVAYIQSTSGSKSPVHARLFYKDLSLMWRVASHVVLSKDELWIGKGDTEEVVHGDDIILESKESTTDLPFEIQGALDAISRRAAVKEVGDSLFTDVLRRAPPGRIQPYPDFVRLRRRAARDPKNLPNRGRPIAKFTKKNDPKSLKIVRGFEPDYKEGLIDAIPSNSRFYGGDVTRYRVLSANRKIQWCLFVSPTHVWLAPPQALTTELSTFAVRSVDVNVPEELCVPGFEYHFMDDGELHTQIPEGWAGAPHPDDNDRADASRWLNALAPVRELRAHLRRRR